jgi:hypothetical protein
MARRLALMALLVLGCDRSYWITSADLRRARSDAETRVPSDRIALKPLERDVVYLRYSQLRVDWPGAENVRVHAPNKRGKRLGGAILLGVGTALIAGGVAVIGYGISIRARDSVGSGIVAGLGALPVGVGIGLAIPGVVLLTRARGPSDIVIAGDPTMVYFPSP